MKFVVCGCSWSSRDPSFPATEHGHFIAEHFGWEYHNIARVGCDNFGIRLQIDYAIDVLKADVILVNWTTACRVVWNHKGKKYSPTLGLKQLDYSVDKFFDNDRCHPAKDDPDFDPTIIAQSITGLVTFGNLMSTYEEANEEWPELHWHMNKEQFYAFRQYYLNLYDDDLEAHKQYFIMESAVNKMQRHNVKFLFAPNTFNYMQSVQLSNNEEWDHEKHERNVFDELYNDWSFVPRENLLYPGIAFALQWDNERLGGDSADQPDHDNCHHLSSWAQEKWATEVAIPRFKVLL